MISHLTIRHEFQLLLQIPNKFVRVRFPFDHTRKNIPEKKEIKTKYVNATEIQEKNRQKFTEIAREKFSPVTESHTTRPHRDKSANNTLGHSERIESTQDKQKYKRSMCPTR